MSNDVILPGTGSVVETVDQGGNAVTNGATAAGNAVLHFASTPAFVANGMGASDFTVPAAIAAGTIVTGFDGTTVTLSANAANAGVGNGDTIVFTAQRQVVQAKAADGDQVTIGAIADAAVAAGAAGTLSAKLRALSRDLLGLQSDSAAAGNLTALNSAVALTTGGKGTGIFEITGVWVGTITFEGSNNSFATAQPLSAVLFGTPQNQASTTTTNGFFAVPTAGFAQVRARMSAYTSGIAAVLANGSLDVRHVVPVQGNPNNNQTLASLASSTVAAAVSPAVTAGAYTAGNIMGGIMVFAGLLDATRFAGVLESITVKFKGTAVTGAVNLCLFKASPSNGAYADKTAGTWNAADMANLVGVYQLATALSPLGAMTVYNLDGIGKAIVGTTQSLFGILTVAGTPTPASTADLTVEVAMLPG